MTPQAANMPPAALLSVLPENRPLEQLLGSYRIATRKGAESKAPSARNKSARQLAAPPGETGRSEVFADLG